jgi:cytochrome P450
MGTTVESFDPLSPAVLEDPYPFYAMLRREAPVFYLADKDAYLIARYADVLSALKDPKTFSNRGGPGMRPQPSPQMKAVIAKGYRVPNTLVSNDPPSHTRYRKLVGSVFTPRRVQEWEELIRGIAGDLIDDFADDRGADIIAQYAAKLPLLLMVSLLGVERENIVTFKKWSDDAMEHLSGVLSPAREVQCMDSRVEFQRYFASRIEKRREEPVDDLLSHLANATVDEEERLTLEEVLAIVHLLMVAGQETTGHLIGSGTRLLLERPDDLHAVCSDVSLIPNMLDETMRFATPIMAQRRLTLQEATVAGVTIPADKIVYTSVASANRDETVFDAADRYDIRRANASKHLGFGHGIHFCLGSVLAKLEARVAFETMFERMRDLRFAPGYEPRHVPSMNARGLRSLDVEFS